MLEKDVSIYDLSSDDGLKRACNDLEAEFNPADQPNEWREKLVKFLTRTKNANEDERASEQFQRILWDDNPISAVGMGTVKVDKAVLDAGFRRWLAQQSLIPMPTTYEQRLVHFRKLFNDLLDKLEPFCDRKPRLKVFRVLASFYPDYFTTIAHGAKAKKLAIQMLGSGLQPIERHLMIRKRLDDVLGPTGESIEGKINRLMLPWYLYAEAIPKGEEEETITTTNIPGEDRLLPLPAARRRRGMTSMKDGFNTVLSVLEFARDGVTRDELKDYLKAQNPSLKDSSLNTQVNVIRGELGLLQRDGEDYVLSERGEAVLESGDASELADWILTRILGVDHAIAYLRDHGPTESAHLQKIIQAVHPGWTTQFVPSSILAWLRQFGVIDYSDSGVLKLTEEGQQWASLIHWEPQSLPKDDSTSAANKSVDPLAKSEHFKIALPTIDSICSYVKTQGLFSDTLVTSLHAGIWSHERRHFAVLTGLSGSGKTLLARAYARALFTTEDSDGDKHLQTVAVQPGWYDPSPLLGYINPLRSETYMTTPFLDFLLQAIDNPREPYVVVLDEMNLSRPEQYFSPFLSAMETGASIDLHREGDILDGIPASIPYPNNLVIIGTVNMDETTHGLSDKVLDRAFTLEFWDIDLMSYPRWGQRGLKSGSENKAREILIALMEALRPARLHFGWRVVDDVLDFLKIMEQSSSQDIKTTLDSVIYARILPKLRGDDTPRFRQALRRCTEALESHGLSESKAKLIELTSDLEHTGSARFWR